MTQVSAPSSLGGDRPYSGTAESVGSGTASGPNLCRSRRVLNQITASARIPTNQTSAPNGSTLAHIMAVSTTTPARRALVSGAAHARTGSTHRRYHGCGLAELRAITVKPKTSPPTQCPSAPRKENEDDRDDDPRQLDGVHPTRRSDSRKAQNREGTCDRADGSRPEPTEAAPDAESRDGQRHQGEGHASHHRRRPPPPRAVPAPPGDRHDGERRRRLHGDGQRGQTQGPPRPLGEGEGDGRHDQPGHHRVVVDAGDEEDQHAGVRQLLRRPLRPGWRRERRPRGRPPRHTGASSQ